MILLGISGQLNSGKDSVAGRFADNLEIVHIALADPMKQFGEQVFGFTDDQLWGPSHLRNGCDERYFKDSSQWILAHDNLKFFSPSFIEKVCGEIDDQYLFSLFDWFENLQLNNPNLSPRIMLQTLGTEWGRDCVNEDVWVNYMIRRAANIVERGIAGVVVSDVRFKNELEAIRKAGGKLVKVVRPVTDQNALETGVKNHQSESEQKFFDNDQFNFIILNDSSLEDLYDKVDKISEYI